MIYYSSENRKDYTFPLLGNGDIAFNPDCEGGVCAKEAVFSGEDGIYRAGRRAPYYKSQNAPAPLMRWGSIRFDCGSDVHSFAHELHEQDGFVSSKCEYDGFTIDTKCFIHQKYNLYAISKKFKGKPKKASFTLFFDDILTDNVKNVTFTKSDNAVSVDFNIRAYDIYEARIVVTSDKIAKISTAQDRVTFDFEVSDGDSLCFYYCLEDSLYCENYKQAIENILCDINKKGFDGLFDENKKIWNDYHSQGYIKTQDELINSVYSTAMYHLKCYTTRWSIPVSLNNRSWYGKFFAFDEYYSYLSLLQSGKTDLAKRVPDFRAGICYEVAERRATDYNKNPDTVHARYVWESGEHGEELAPPGFWMDHIFHMAVIALGAFEYYEYTNDTDFLEKCYPMIKSCAKFYTLNSIYEDSDGNLYVGKCTDLERLGANVFNPFFTSCGVIKTLEVLSKAAKILNCDDEYRKECEYKAKMLKKTLPNDGEKYVPHIGCSQKSIAVFCGKYPFNVLDNNDSKLLPALLDFIENEKAYGNMYPVGKRVSPWYCAWKSIAFARMGMEDEAYLAFQQALESVGPFAEVFEINEEAVVQRPWFSTAAGVLSSALNEMLLQSDGENIYLLPAAGQTLSTVSFKLAAKGGAIIETKINDGNIEKLDISFRPGVENKEIKVYLKGKRVI